MSKHVQVAVGLALALVSGCRKGESFEFTELFALTKLAGLRASIAATS